MNLVHACILESKEWYQSLPGFTHDNIRSLRVDDNRIRYRAFTASVGSELATSNLSAKSMAAAQKLVAQR
jgi:hypothetical protein